MKIAIGSGNPIKIQAVKEVLSEYNMFNNSEIKSVKVESNVSEQPSSINETMQGAKNRAKNAYDSGNFDYGIGIESGIMKTEGTNTNYYAVSISAIYDGKEFHTGSASLFEYPKKVIEFVIKKNKTINEGAHKSGMAKNQKIGSEEGMIGILTKGRVPRKEHEKEGLRMALIQIENKELY